MRVLNVRTQRHLRLPRGAKKSGPGILPEAAFAFQLARMLSVSAAVAATTVGATAAVESAATMTHVTASEAGAAVTHIAASESAADCAASAVGLPAVKARSPVVAGTRVNPTASAPISRASPVSRAAIVSAMEPRAGTDEDSARKVAGAIVTIGRASVRSVAVVAVGADRSLVIIARPANSHSDDDALSVCEGSSEQNHRKHR